MPGRHAPRCSRVAPARPCARLARAARPARHNRRKRGRSKGARRTALPAVDPDAAPAVTRRLGRCRREDKLMLKWDLTFDMSGGPKGAKRPLERPLDGGVRGQVCSEFCARAHDALGRTRRRRAALMRRCTTWEQHSYGKRRGDQHCEPHCRIDKRPLLAGVHLREPAFV